MKKSSIALLALALVFVGCQEKQQPVLTINDITTFATISGTISYEKAVGVTPATATMPAMINYDTIPLANEMVEVKVDASQYNQNAWGVLMTFSGMTDASGKFDIQVPVLASATNFTVTEVAAKPFYLQEFPIYTATYTYDPVTYAYTVTYIFTNEQVYYDGTLPTLALPATIYAGRTYFLGNEFIMYNSFMPVGL